MTDRENLPSLLVKMNFLAQNPIILNYDIRYSHLSFFRGALNVGFLIRKVNHFPTNLVTNSIIFTYNSC